MTLCIIICMISIKAEFIEKWTTFKKYEIKFDGTIEYCP